MGEIWHWLVMHGLFDDLVGWLVITLLGWLVHLLRQHVREQKRTNDLLDAETPGGLHEVCDAIRRASRGGHVH